MLLHYYKLEIGDQRLYNDTFTTGEPDGGKSIAYAIYVAFTLEELTKEDDFEDSYVSSKTSQPVEGQTTSDLDDAFSSQLDIYAQETWFHVTLPLNTSASSLSSQEIKERSSSSDSNAFVISLPQLDIDKVTGHQATTSMFPVPLG